MMHCGDYYEVDYLARYQLQDPSPDESLVLLTLSPPKPDLNRQPWKNLSQTHSIVLVPPLEQEKLATALDCLPWSQLGWSVHRGLQCLLVAYAKPIMDLFREALASKFQTAVTTEQNQLTLKLWGWKDSFIKNHMGCIAANSLKVSGGSSGDNVCIVTDIAKLLVEGSPVDLDETRFCRERIGNRK